DLVAPDGVEVRHVAEHRAQEVADEYDLGIRKPDYERVGGLPAWCRVELEAALPELEAVAVEERPGQHRLGWMVRRVDVCGEAAPQLQDPPHVEGVERAPVLAH